MGDWGRIQVKVRHLNQFFTGTVEGPVGPAGNGDHLGMQAWSLHAE
jgi:hypothetical protein